MRELPEFSEFVGRLRREIVKASLTSRKSAALKVVSDYIDSVRESSRKRPNIEYSTPLALLLPEWLANKLERLGFLTAGSIKAVSYEEILEFPGIGSRGADMLVKRLGKYAPRSNRRVNLNVKAE
ncbi:MAG: hypothetical protein KatS3mg109_0105 [Pirellulaceae bacterium]|nr:MAG: hypothetical protein KatS3mg109_0105 [Pirellulaceae bacterium]